MLLSLCMLSLKRFLTGDENKKKLKGVDLIVLDINQKETPLMALSDKELAQKTVFFKERLKKQNMKWNNNTLIVCEEFKILKII